MVHGDSSKRRRSEPGQMTQQAGIAHGPGDFSSRTGWFPSERRGQALVEMTIKGTPETMG
jgi:hypothetical protein